MKTLLHSFSRSLVALLLAAVLLLQSCSASAHLGKVSVSKPDPTEKDAMVWYRYYQDQLDGYGGNAVAPAGAVIQEQGWTLPAEGTYNQAAIDGYEQARLERSVAETKSMKRKTWGMVGGVTAFTVLLPLAILIPVLHNADANTGHP
ncbi:MAG TPA: hypothetical protein VNZ86_10810 [Bacteroidia bacterium]|jgi:hypothetical protein|nr:hypothetical protein [Bacteroidia bacterium]